MTKWKHRTSNFNYIGWIVHQDHEKAAAGPGLVRESATMTERSCAVNMITSQTDGNKKMLFEYECSRGCKGDLIIC